MIPLNDPKILNAFHIDDLLREAEKERLVQEAEHYQSSAPNHLMLSTGNALISAGNWFKSRSKHSQN